jgi:hypothetical protein
VRVCRNPVSGDPDAVGGPIAEASDKGKERTMDDQVVVVGTIRPGKRAELEHMLAAGPPFDLATSGFTNHYAFVGDRTVVFVFEGAEAHQHLRDLTTRLPMKELARLGLLIHHPELLTERVSWTPATNAAGTHA